MTETASLPGGGSLQFSINVQEMGAVTAALNAIDKSDTTSQVVYVTTGPVPSPSNMSGVFTAYQLTPTSGQTYTLPSHAHVAALEGSANAGLTSADGTSSLLLVGNEGNDTITVGSSSSGNVFAGDGANTINIGAGDKVTITAGHGSDTINAAGNDTITLGTGSDTLTATGSATVFGGSGAESITGGSGSFKFYGTTSPTGMDTVVGGSGTNFFEGGAGDDTFVSGAAKGATSDIFEFSSTSAGGGADSMYAGGTHTITGFVSGTDQIDLHGYTASDITNETHSAGSTVIHLNDGTSISVDSTLSNPNDIKFT